MRLIFDCHNLGLYPVGKPGFHGGTELMVQEIAHGLAMRGHMVHVVTPDLESEEQRGPTEFWWTDDVFPTQADAVVMLHDIRGLEPYSADILILATNGIDPWLGVDDAMVSGIDAFPCFSQCHIDMMRAAKSAIPVEKCFITDLGVSENGHSWQHYVDQKVPGRLAYFNDPKRGLFHVLDIYDQVRKRVPEATLHITYEFDLQFQFNKWHQSQMSEYFWECKRRAKLTPGIVLRQELTPQQVYQEQVECQVHAMPSDPPNRGSQIHGIAQMECAATATPLVLSQIEAFPEVFGEAATLLPVPGTFFTDGQAGSRFGVAEWGEVVADLILDKKKWTKASKKSFELAKKHTWSSVVDKWETMLVQLKDRVKEQAP